MNTHLSILAATALVAGLSAQDCPRPETALSTGNVTTSAAGFSAWKLAAPKQNLAGDPSLGLAPTPRVTYAAFVDGDASGVTQLVVRRSVDGGASFEPSVVIWDAGRGDFNAGDLRIAADGHHVWVSFKSNGGVVPGAVYQWVAGSNDQGQTWQTIPVSNGITNPLSSGDILFDVSNPGDIDAAMGICHVAFNANYFSAVGTGGTNSTAEDNYYQGVRFDANGNLALVLPEELRMESYPSGTADSDDPFVAADGNNVLIAWQDVSGGGSNSTGNDTYTRVSNDGGQTWGPVFNHTNFAGGARGVDTGFATCAVGGSAMVVNYQGGITSTRGTGDRLYCSISQDAGATWTTTLEVSQGPNDTDNNCVAIVGQRILWGYECDRTGTDEIYVVVDQNAGSDLIGGTITSDTLVSSGVATGNQEIYFADGYGDTLAVTYEPEVASAEGAGFSFSTDGGLTWELCTAQTSSDVDDTDIAVTINGDITIVYQWDAGQGNDFNNVYFAGAKAQRLVLNATSIDYVGAAPARAGDLVLFLPSLSAPISNGLDLGNTSSPVLTGVAYNFTPDLLTLAAIGEFLPFLGTIDANGNASVQIPNFAPLIGQSIYWIGVTAEASVPNRFSRDFTDTVEQN